MERSEQNTLKKTRLICWDTVKGVLIALVVFAHCLYAFQDRRIINFLVDSIYFFHMPAFVFVSGHFSKSEHSRSAVSLVKLGCAYLLLLAVHLVLAVFQGEALRLLVPYYSSWYLLALIVWRLTVPYVSRSKWSLPLLLLSILLLGFWQDADNTLGFSRILSFYPFFLAGYLFTPEKAKAFFDKPTAKKVPLGLGLLALAGALAIVTEKLFHPDNSAFLFFPYPAGSIRGLPLRMLILLVAFLCIPALLALVPVKHKVPLLTRAGKNSLAIYLIHRPLTLVLNPLLAGRSSKLLLAAAVLFTLFSLLVLGSDPVAKLLNWVLDVLTEAFLSLGRPRSTPRWKRSLAFLLVLGILTVPAAKLCAKRILSGDSGEAARTNEIFRVADKETELRTENAFCLLFAGDLILLEDQVKNGYTGSGYDYSDLFTYTRPYIESADLAIGVFEGPCAGNVGTSYSSSNYGDGKTLYVNFPDEWAAAIKDAGFDLVTTANNHLLDRGVDGALRTLSVLDEIGLDHTGSYASPADKEAQRVKIVERDGIRFVVLSYTFAINGHPSHDFINGENAWLTSMIVEKGSPDYDACLAAVEADFARARALGADLIVVLPHWGTQFEDTPDDLQLLWEQNFKDLGADIILGDHTHSVQPVKIEQVGGRNVFTLYSPGNYANIYREYDGDFSALVEVYIDRDTKEVIGGAIVPMWTESPYSGNYRALPLYQILTDQGLGATLSTRDMERVDQAIEHISSVMLGTNIPLQLVQERYYFDAQGFYRVRNTSIELTDQMREGPLYQAIQRAENVCFVGDSVTEGTKNGGVPWYEPLEDFVPGNIINCGWGSATVQTLLNDHMDEICAADANLFVVAIGTNDVRYRDEKICAMDEQAYIERMQQLRDGILRAHPDAEFIFIAPWISTDGDAVSKLSYPEKLEMNRRYSDALKAWALANGDGYLDPNGYIGSVLELYPHSDYLVDYIHPNATAGVTLYSAAALLAR
jgi:fucose 4-O-acetylase-like acetyltransferase